MKLILRLLILSICFLTVTTTVHSQISTKGKNEIAIERARNGWWAESMKTHGERIKWWNEARFGMFVHWGVYSVPAGVWKDKGIGRSYSEHLMRIMKIPNEEYNEKLVVTFNPIHFDADQWIKLAKDAGMKYFVITAKHHDGFAMYDSDVTPYNIVDGSAFERDPMIELKQACKKYGIKFGFYYSHAFDWEHPDAPGNDWDYENPGGDDLLFGGRNYYDSHPELIPRMAKYVDQKSIPQIKELLTKYEPDIIWFDTPHKLAFFENLRILEELREIAPNVVVNGRLVGEFGDYLNTADKPLELFPTTAKYWEAIPTTNESYGYNKVDDSHKPASHFIHLLAKSASRGGNLLMNIGPKGNGEIDQNDIDILNGIGNWLKVNGESIYGTDKSSLPIQSWGVTTKKDNNLYLHVFNYPKDGKLILGGLKSNFDTAHLLSDNSKSILKTKRINKNDIEIILPKVVPDSINSVILLKINNPIESNNSRLLALNSKNQLLAFDAELIGKGLKYGSGQSNRYYVFNWIEKSQALSWDVRVNSDTTFELKLKYVIAKNSGGTYKISINNDIIKGDVEPSKNKTETKEVNLGVISLKKGTNKIQISPENITGEELMKVFELNLIPIK